MKHLPKPKAILFDWDNTLVNTWPIIHNALVHAFKHMGQTPWTFEQTKERVRKSMRDSFPEIFGERWEEAGKIYQQKYKENHLKDIEPMPGAEELLKQIKKANLYSAVVSNKTGNNLRLELEALNWQSYFARAVGSLDAARDKPHPEPVHMALEGSGIAPSKEVWFVGDSEIDIETANKLGMTAVLYGARNLEQELGLVEDTRIREFQPFLDFMKNF